MENIAAFLSLGLVYENDYSFLLLPPHHKRQGGGNTCPTLQNAALISRDPEESESVDGVVFFRIQLSMDKVIALRLIAERLSEEEVHNLREAFKIVDNEKSERVTYKAFLEDSTPILTTWISTDCHNAWIPSYNSMYIWEIEFGMSHCHTYIKLNIKLGGDLMGVDKLLLDSKVVPFFDEGEKAELAEPSIKSAFDIGIRIMDQIEDFSQNRKRDGGYFNADGNFV
ncbi:unnamed protein product [Brassica napus]|uniref:(rape) hypothetical protein n=1 Tax=Brassica napus TaxID=3708 RepID=A0A816KHZ8_BRANA|nr:unnamed protein product [Brassica napus]